MSRLVSLAAERWEVPNFPGCLLGKVLGSGKEGTTTTSVDLRRWLIFSVWTSRQALLDFEQNSEIIPRWTGQAEALERYELLPLTSRGSWAGADPLSSVTREPNDDSPIAVLTRASVRWPKIVTFTRAIPAVDEALRASPGCERAMGIGEWPIGQQATFSTWTNTDAMNAFAHVGSEHSEVIRRTYRENWYSEEMFSRFQVSDHKQLKPVSLDQT